MHIKYCTSKNLLNIANITHTLQICIFLLIFTIGDVSDRLSRLIKNMESSIIHESPKILAKKKKKKKRGKKI